MQKVEENVKKGFTYPKAVVIAVTSGGHYGHIHHHYYFDGEKFNFICAIPTWATENGKYSVCFDRLIQFKELPKFKLASFMKEKGPKI
jgi:hypothetical protein